MRQTDTGTEKSEEHRDRDKIQSCMYILYVVLKFVRVSIQIA